MVEKADDAKKASKPKRKVDYIIANSAYAHLSKELPQYDLAAMQELYTGFQVGGDPIINQVLGEVGEFKKQMAEHRAKAQEYQGASEEDRKELKDPGQFQLDPRLSKAVQVFQEAQDIYSNKFLEGYFNLSVKDALEWASSRDQEFPEKLGGMIEACADKKVVDLADEGNEGIVKQAVYAMIPQITQARLLPKLIYKITSSRLEQLVNTREESEMRMAA